MQRRIETNSFSEEKLKKFFKKLMKSGWKLKKNQKLTTVDTKRTADDYVTNRGLYKIDRQLFLVAGEREGWQESCNHFSTDTQNVGPW